MKFTKKLLSVITIMFLGIFYSKETYSKEKKLKTDYSYVTEKINIYSDENKKENIGYLIYFFEKACAIYCKLLGVNAFNQPGVEAYKKNMAKLLNKPNS